MNEESKPLPKSILLVAGVLVVLIMSAFIPARYIGVKPVKYDTPIDYSKLKTAETFTKEVDTDSNGTLTWKELMTNVAGEDSLLVNGTTTEDPEIMKALADPNNLTASFSKNLAVSTAYLKNNNITDADAQKRVLDGITNEEKAKIVSKKYLPTDIILAKSDDKATIKAYGNELAKLLNDLITKKNIQEDLPGVIAYSEKGDPVTLIPISKDAERVGGIVTKVLTLKVPPSATVHHLLMLNQLVIYRDLLRNLASAKTDPVRSALVIDSYTKVLLATGEQYDKMSNYFTTKNIVFMPHEPGYIFTIGYTLH